MENPKCAKDVLFVDLRKKLNSLTFRSNKFSTCIYRLNSSVYGETKSRIIFLANNQRHILSNFQFFVKRTQKYIRGQTIDKTMANPN